MRRHILDFDNMDVEILMEGVHEFTLEHTEQNFINELQPETNMINPMWKDEPTKYPKYRYDWIERRYNFNYELPFSKII